MSKNSSGIKNSNIRWERIIAAGVLLVVLLLLVFKGLSSLFSGDDDDSIKKTEKSSSSADSSDSEEDTGIKYDLTVCIDPGHGDYASGTLSTDGSRLEKDDNLRISLKLRDCLKKYGVNVVMTRDTDVFLELEERTDIANNSGCDLFLCMHRNAYTGEMNGVEVWVHNSKPSEDTTLANNILTALEKVGISYNRGVSYGYSGDETENYYVNNHSKMPSCLVELGFLTDETDNKDFDAHIDEYAQAIADAAVKTAVDLGITDNNGNRLAQKPFFTRNNT